jgi:hypothetical protein
MCGLTVSFLWNGCLSFNNKAYASCSLKYHLYNDLRGNANSRNKFPNSQSQLGQNCLLHIALTRYIL